MGSKKLMDRYVDGVYYEVGLICYTSLFVTFYTGWARSVMGLAVKTRGMPETVAEAELTSSVPSGESPKAIGVGPLTL